MTINYKSMKIKKLRFNKTVHFLLWFSVLLIIWEIASRIGLVNSYILPPFSTVINNMFNQLISGNLGLQVMNSLFILFCGVGLAFIITIIVILLCSLSLVIETLFTTLSTIFNPLPAVALMPIIILWFGIDTNAMLAIIVHSVLWSSIRYLLDGIRTIPKVYYEWCDNIELSFVRKFVSVTFFAILPNMVAGIRVGWGNAWRALLSAEMIFGTIGTFGGIGYYIYSARAYANITNVMSGVIVIVIIGIIIESLLFKKLEELAVKRWGMICG